MSIVIGVKVQQVGDAVGEDVKKLGGVNRALHKSFNDVER